MALAHNPILPRQVRGVKEFVSKFQYKAKKIVLVSFLKPKPPAALGIHTRSHATKHFAPEKGSSLDQKKIRLRLSISSRTLFGRVKQSMKYV
jgi:hypothetical protein